MLLLTVAALACSGPAAPAASGVHTATGVVVSVDGPSVTEVAGFSLRSSDGTQFELTVGVLDVANGGLAAPHLREHLVSGDPITVEYRVEGGQNVATRYVDAE